MGAGLCGLSRRLPRNLPRANERARRRATLTAGDDMEYVVCVDPHRHAQNVHNPLRSVCLSHVFTVASLVPVLGGLLDIV